MCSSIKLSLWALLLFAMSTLALPAVMLPETTGVSAVEKFYEDKLEPHVESIAEQIVAFNMHHHNHEKPIVNHRGHHHVANSDVDEEMLADQPPQQGHVNNSQHEEQLRKLRQEQEYQTGEDREKLAENSIKRKVIAFITNSNGSNGVRDRSFYANCDQPKSSEENDELMKLYFTLPQLEDTIAEANLRLYRKTITNQMSNDDPMPCVSTTRNDNSAEAEKVYRVTVFYHVKGAKKHKLKKKIGESRVMTESKAFVNLDVLHGVREVNKGKHFGVIIQIEDQYGTIVKANEFFKGPTCTVGMPTAHPLPTAFEEAHPNFGRITNPADFIRKSVPPKLDIKTIQEPEDGTASANAESVGNRCKQVPMRHAKHNALANHQRPRIENPIIVFPKGAYDGNEVNFAKILMEANAKAHH